MDNDGTVGNIGPEQRRLRRVMGAWTLAAAVALAVLASVLGWGLAVRLLSAPLFFGGFVGVLQSREHTCVALASRGLCDMDDGARRMEDPDRLRAVRARARGILLKSAAGAAIATLVVALLP